MAPGGTNIVTTAFAGIVTVEALVTSIVQLVDPPVIVKKRSNGAPLAATPDAGTDTFCDPKGL